MTEAVRAFLYPILEPGNLSFPDASYGQEFAKGVDRCSVTLTHRLEGCPFLERLIARRQAAYSCVVSIPITGYRRLFVSEGATQLIRWDEDSLGEPPFFRPQIIATSDIRCVLAQDDGVGPDWVGRPVAIGKGAKLGFGPYHRMASSIQTLLRINLDPDLAPGTFSVQPCTNDGFHFNVGVAADLHPFLRWGGEAPLQRRSILTHVVGSCLELLRKDYSGKDEEGEESWKSHSNLRALAIELANHGLPPWDADGFKPEMAATIMHPHKPPAGQGDPDPE